MSLKNFLTLPDLSLPKPNTKLWRYITLPNLISILANNALWFSRADQLGDPVEGSLSPYNLEKRDEVYNGSIPAEQLAGMALIRERQTRRVFCNCWFSSEYESWGMWSNYSGNNGVVIVSDYGALESSLEHFGEMFAGLVEYVDFSKTFIPEGNLLYPYFHKQIQYQSEQEFRLIISSFGPSKILGPTNPDINQPALSANGVNVTANLSSLIKEIRIHPQTPEWFKSDLTATISKFGFSFKISDSEIASIPSF